METTVNTRVIFSAIRKAVSLSDEDITYTETVANIGNGMNPKTGVFTVPVSGIYSFSFSALKDPNYTHFCNVYVKKNGEQQFRIRETDFNAADYYGNIGYSWTMALVQNDEILLSGDIYDHPLYVDNLDFIWFNGHLLMKQ